MPSVGDVFINVLGAEVTFVPAPRINVEKWLRFWQDVTSNKDAPGFVAAAAMMAQSSDVILTTARDTLVALEPKMNELLKRAAKPIYEEIEMLTGALWAQMAVIQQAGAGTFGTAKAEAIWMGVVVPSLWSGVNSTVSRIASVANQVEYLAPDNVRWEWGGVFGGDVSLVPGEPWDIYAGVARALTNGLVQLEESAPGERATVMDRMKQAAAAVAALVKQTPTFGIELALGLVLAFLVLRKL